MTATATKSLASIMLRLFRGRANYVAVPNGKDFMPEKLTAPLAAERFEAQHLGGHGCLGFYVLDAENNVYCCAVDFDNKPENPDPEWQRKTEAVVDHLEGLDLSPLVELSQSGNASHVWLFFAEAIPAWLVRRFWGKVSAAVAIKFNEIYPRQNRLKEPTEKSPEPLGNLIRYPLWNKSRFVDVGGDWQEIEPLNALDSVKPINSADFRELCATLGIDLTEPSRKELSNAAKLTEPTDSNGAGPSDEEILAKCFNAANGDRFETLWHGQKLASHPSNSEAHMALASMVTFFSGPRPDVIERLLRRSGFGDCEKFQRAGYLTTLIEKVIVGKSAGDFYSWNGQGSSTIKVVIANAEKVTSKAADGNNSTKTVAIPLRKIIKTIQATTGGWPRRVDSALFVDDGQHGIGWLESTAALFGWLNSKVDAILWYTGVGCAAKTELYAELRRVAKAYKAVETLPHVPPMASCYYTCGTPEPGDGGSLRWLLDRFCPETNIDRDLICSAWATTIWGGPGGARPAFVITSDAGRGAGKTKLATMIGEFAGGVIEVSAKEEISTIKQRLLSPDGLTKRVALLDNVKSLKFSWADLEALITASVISGKRMYIGEGSRPNSLLWLITLNGASLSSDMAQRSVVIKLKKAPRSASWEENTRKFIADNRQAILADLVSFFQQPKNPPRTYSRWAAWEGDVLSRLPEPEEAQLVIAERQRTADVDIEEALIVTDYFRDQLEQLEYCTVWELVFIPNEIAARWYNAATNTRGRVTGVSRTLRQMNEQGHLDRIEPAATRSYGRGFVWVGAKVQPATQIRVDIREKLSQFAQSAES